MPKFNLKKLGAKIRQLREDAGYSQEELASIAGLHRTYIGGVERGEHNISIMNLIRISRALKSPLSAIFEGLL